MKKYLPYIIIIVLVIIFAIVVQMSTQSGKPGSSTTSIASESSLKNGSYNILGDSFTLSGGQAIVQHGTEAQASQSSTAAVNQDTMPVSYTYATSTSGTITATSTPGAVAALYRGFGANIIWVTLAAFSTDNGSLQQIAAAPVYEQDASIQSLSLDNGIVTLNLLIVSDADQNLPHYEQKPTQPLTLKFQIKDGAFVRYVGN